MTTLTNAELAAAIEWAASRLVDYQTTGSPSREATLIYDHLTELLRIQRERAAAIIIKEVPPPPRPGMHFYRKAYDTECRWHDEPPNGIEAASE